LNAEDITEAEKMTTALLVVDAFSCPLGKKFEDTVGQGVHRGGATVKWRKPGERQGTSRTCLRGNSVKKDHDSIANGLRWGGAKGVRNLLPRSGEDETERDTWEGKKMGKRGNGIELAH